MGRKKMDNKATPKLNDQQKLFCDEYIVDRNAYQAALRAGYAETTAKAKSAGWLEKDGFSKYIKERLAEKDAALIAKQDEVLKTLTRILRREECDTVVVMKKTSESYYDEKGKRITKQSEEPMLVEIPTQVRDVNRAGELLGKTYGLFTDKVDLSTDITLDFLTGDPGGD